MHSHSSPPPAPNPHSPARRSSRQDPLPSSPSFSPVSAQMQMQMPDHAMAQGQQYGRSTSYGAIPPQASGMSYPVFFLRFLLALFSSVGESVMLIY